METVVPAGDATAVVIYSHRVFYQAIRSTVAAKLMAVGLNPKDQTNYVQMFDESMKGPGDTIKYDLIPNPQGPGVAGDGVLAGQEVAFTWFQNTLTINQLRQAELLVGRMSQQRVPYSMRDVAKVGLANWWKETIDYGLLNQLGGNTYISNAANFWGTNMSGMQAPVAPDSSHWIFAAGRTSEATLAQGDVFTVDLIPTLVAKAQGTLQFPIKPVVIKGVEISGVLFLHPLQVRSLKQNYTQGEWGDIFRAALQGGQITGNPIFTGAIGMIDNVVIHQDSHVPYGDTSQNTVQLAINGTLVTKGAPNALGAAAVGVTSICRGIFVGAQAAALAFGGEEGPDGKPLRVKWTEELLDGANQLRISAGMIWGCQKTVFNSQDYATIVVSSYETA
jgi:N4-gp56 family major capsid protein